MNFLVIKHQLAGSVSVLKFFLKIFMKLKKLEENFTFFSQLDDSVLGFEMKWKINLII